MTLLVMKSNRLQLSIPVQASAIVDCCEDLTTKLSWGMGACNMQVSVF